MHRAESEVDAIGPDQKQMYAVGGIAAILLGVGYLIIFPLYAKVGTPPSGGEGWFRYLPGKTSVWWAILGLSVFTDFLYVPLALALYMALKSANRTAMLLATALIGLFVALDLGVTWSHYASILNLFSEYSAATDEVQRASYLAAANYGSAMLTSPLEIIYAIVTLSSAILIVGFVTVKGAFNKATAYVALATGVFGVASLTGLSFAIIGNALFATAWLFCVGHRLCRLARG